MTAQALKKTSLSSPDERAKQAAVECFSKNGIANTSMDDVAQQAGMARSTLYRYFKDKDQLIIEVMEQEAVLLAGELSSSIKAENFGDYIIQGVLLAVAHIPKHPVLGKMFAPDTLETSARVVLMTNHLSKVAIDVISPAIEAAKKQGVLREALTPEMLIDWVVRIIFSVLTIRSDATQNQKKTRLLLETMLLPAILNE